MLGAVGPRELPLFPLVSFVVEHRHTTRQPPTFPRHLERYRAVTAVFLASLALPLLAQEISGASSRFRLIHVL
jgi:hypothetical protein